MSFIKIDNLKKYYQSKGETVEAVKNISLQIGSGEFLALMGPSGSGKSTLLSTIGGLSHPTDGNVIIDEIEIYRLSQEKLADFRSEYIGFVFQSFQLIPYLTVMENVMLPLAFNSHTKKEQQLLSDHILDRVGLSLKMKRLPDELSGGEQERVAIARALVNNPPIILADEPTGNLDTKTGEEIMKLFRELNREGQTIIMVTHNPDNLKFVNQSVHLKDGKLTT